MHVSTRMMAERCLPSPVTVPRWVPVTPVTMSTSSWVSWTGSWSRTVPFSFCRQGPHRGARRNSCILTGVGSETMALPSCQTLSTSLHLNNICKTYIHLILNGSSPTGKRLSSWISSYTLLMAFLKLLGSATIVIAIFLHIVVRPNLSSRGSFQEWVRDCACCAPMIKLSRKDSTNIQNTFACLFGSGRKHKKNSKRMLQEEKEINQPKKKKRWKENSMGSYIRSPPAIQIKNYS